jgi:hypothetical protein
VGWPQQNIAVQAAYKGNGSFVLPQNLFKSREHEKAIATL